jgi:hypothetical protein
VCSSDLLVSPTWSYSLPSGASISAAAAVDARGDGAVYFTSSSALYKVSSAGALVWAAPLSAPAVGSPFLNPSGAFNSIMVLQQTAGGQALLSAWSLTAASPQPTCTAAAVTSTNVTNVTSCGLLSVGLPSGLGQVVCAAGGALLSTEIGQSPREEVGANVALLPAGTVVVAPPIAEAAGNVVVMDSITGRVTSLAGSLSSSSSGSGAPAPTLWSADLPPGTQPSAMGALALGADGTVYVGTSVGTLVALGVPNCPPGQFAGTFGCTLCPAGSWSSATGNVPACQLCPPGTASFIVGATDASSCAPCAPGSAAPSPGATACGLCPAGTWAPSGAPSCTPCSDA